MFPLKAIIPAVSSQNETSAFSTQATYKRRNTEGKQNYVLFRKVEVLFSGGILASVNLFYVVNKLIFELAMDNTISLFPQLTS